MLCSEEVTAEMPPSSPGRSVRLVVTRLLLCLALVLTFTLTLVSLYHYPEHYRYVSWDSMGSATQDLSTHSYAIVIDAGSSSSKVHLFHWPPHDGNPHKLLDIHPLTDELGDPLTKKVEPGISTFSATPQAAFNSLIPLLEFSSAHIPREKHPHTVLYILGTAGMRLLSTKEQEGLMEYLKAALEQEFPFHLPQDGIQVISGKMEGVFSWITINYLLGHFSPESHTLTTPPNQHVHTVGVMDMGGASLQIAFEVPPWAEVSSDRVVEINLGCGIHDNTHKHRVYCQTYLGYGSNTARAKYYDNLATHLNSSNHTTLQGPSLKDPCGQRGLTENITLSQQNWVHVRGMGDFPSCRTALSSLLRPGGVASGGETRGCGSKGCSEDNNSFERPPGDLDYTSLDFYGTSEFFYTMRDVLRLGGVYSAAEFESKSSKFCQTEWQLVRARHMKQLYTYANLYRLQSQCLKSAWLSAVLHTGLEFPHDSLSLHTLSSLHGQSVQWPLGALLYSTKYLPLREVQLQQQHQAHRTTQYSRWDFHTLILPLIAVFCVILLLLLYRHRHNHTPLLSPGSNFRLRRSFSQSSGLKIHRRAGSVSIPSSSPGLPRIQSSSRVDWMV